MRIWNKLLPWLTNKFQKIRLYSSLKFFLSNSFMFKTSKFTEIEGEELTRWGNK